MHILQTQSESSLVLVVQLQNMFCSPLQSSGNVEHVFEVVYRCDGFEESLGALVNAVLPWKEAMQLSEPRVLVKHISVVPNR